METDLALNLRILGRSLREAREALGFSLRELARTSGVSPSQILRIESGEFDCFLSSLVKLCGPIALRPGELLESCLFANWDLYGKAATLELAAEIPIGF